MDDFEDNRSGWLKPFCAPTLAFHRLVTMLLNLHNNVVVLNLGEDDDPDANVFLQPTSLKDVDALETLWTNTRNLIHRGVRNYGQGLKWIVTNNSRELQAEMFVTTFSLARIPLAEFFSGNALYR